VHNAPVEPLAFQTTTGGQLDDDADGFGNQCDADYNQAGVNPSVDSADIALFKVANGKKRNTIDSADLSIFKSLSGTTKKSGDDVMEKCAACGPPFDDPNLACEGDECP
jgi:hypothetical protein